MKPLLLATVAVLILAPKLTIAQGASPASDNTRPAAQTRAVNLSGKVSSDGKVFTADDDNNGLSVTRLR